MIEKTKLPVTLCVITCNSEDRIKEMILKHKDIVSEVLVVVQESKDNTLARAREVADVVIERRRKGLVEPDRNWAFSMASNEWVLYLDDDEYISTELAEELENLISKPIDVYWFKRKNLVDGVDIHAILGEDMQPRLFRKGALSFPSKMHTYPTPAKNACAAFLKHEIVHVRSLEQMKKSNRKRNSVADKRTIEMQENFIFKVEALLDSQV